MPSRSEMGLLRGLGQGLADVGKLGFVATLQEMRDNRLAKIEAQAADEKWAREKELLTMKGKQDRENASFKVDEEVRGKKELTDYFLDKGLAADGSQAKKDKWEVVKGGKTVGKDGLERQTTYFSNGKQIIDTDSPEGRVISMLSNRMGLDAAVSRVNQMDPAGLRSYLAESGGDKQNSSEGGGESGGRPFLDAVANRADRTVEGGKSLIRDIGENEAVRNDIGKALDWIGSQKENFVHAKNRIGGLLSDAADSELFKSLSYSIANPTKEYGDRPADGALPDYTPSVQQSLGAQVGVGPTSKDEARMIRLPGYANRAR